MKRQIVPLAAILAMSGTVLAGAQGTRRDVKLQAKPAASTPAPQTPQATPAQPAKPAQPADPLADAPRISAADAKKAVDAGKAIIVDVRSEAAFNLEHPKGTINIPVQEIYARAGELPKGKQIIAYCT